VQLLESTEEELSSLGILKMHKLKLMTQKPTDGQFGTTF
jgi:hypothetical protein